MRSRMSLLKLKNGSISLIAISMKPGIILPLPSPNSVKPSSSFVVKKKMLSSLNTATKVSVRHAAKPR